VAAAKPNYRDAASEDEEEEESEEEEEASDGERQAGMWQLLVVHDSQPCSTCVSNAGSWQQ
jgi:hypothetical protein